MAGEGFEDRPGVGRETMAWEGQGEGEIPLESENCRV